VPMRKLDILAFQSNSAVEVGYQLAPRFQSLPC